MNVRLIMTQNFNDFFSFLFVFIIVIYFKKSIAECLYLFPFLIRFRRNKSQKLDVSGNLLSCWNRSIYQDIVVKTEEASTYEELNLSANTYQNTAVKWSSKIFSSLNYNLRLKIQRQYILNFTAKRKKKTEPLWKYKKVMINSMDFCFRLSLIHIWLSQTC